MAPTAGARSRGRPHPDLLGRGDRRLEWRGSDVELAAVMVTEPKHPVHGVGAGALRRRTNREDDAAVLNRTGDDLPLELDPIRGRQLDDPVAVRIRDRESLAHRDRRHDDRLLAYSGRCVLDADDLSALAGEGGRGREDAGFRPDLPQPLSGGRVEGAEVAVIRPAGEDEPAAGGQDPSPAHRVGELVTPRPLHSVDVPGLDLAEVLRALVDGEADVGDVDARPPLSRDVLLDLAFHEPAVVVVGRDEEASHLGVVGGRRPVLAAPERRTEVGALTGLWNPLRMVVGTDSKDR